jgi:hypothetical protein
MCCEGKPVEQISQISPWAEQLGQQTAEMIGQGMQQGATPMPQDLFGAYMGAAQMPSFSFGPLQYLDQMYGGGGNQWQPQQFNPMDFYQSIYQQQQPMPQRQYAQPASRG